LIPLKNKFTLVMFVHPQCPCSRASLEELNVIMTSQRAADATAYVAFIKPAGTNARWIHTYSWDRAGEIPNVTRYVDNDGKEARRFGAETSGDCLLYDFQGRLEFVGGITSSRGEEGDNVGCESVLGVLAGDKVSWREHPVFGCALTDAPVANASANQGRTP